LFKLLIDTCVWLDIAKDVQQQPLLNALEELISLNEVTLLVPQIVVDEFARNKARAVEDSNRSLSSNLRRVKEAVAKLGDPRETRRVLRQLNEVDYKLPRLSDTATSSIARIEKLFSDSIVIPVTDGAKLRAAQRALDGAAPFHRQRNGIADAILFEMYVDALRTPCPSRTRFAFVTHNTKDFSRAGGDQRLPHIDLEPAFSRVRSLYFTTLGAALKRIAPGLLSEIAFEHEWTQETRTLSEIISVIDELADKIWYDRHQMRRDAIASGKIKIIPAGTYDPKTARYTIVADIWAGALKSAAKVERKYGIDNVGPYSKFEWGMLNGKLSALRWVLGDEWDMLDT
jgi:hypothetical protein